MSRRQFLFVLNTWKHVKRMTDAQKNANALLLFTTQESRFVPTNIDPTWETFSQWAIDQINAAFPIPEGIPEQPQEGA